MAGENNTMQNENITVAKCKLNTDRKRERMTDWIPAQARNDEPKVHTPYPLLVEGIKDSGFPPPRERQREGDRGG